MTSELYKGPTIGIRHVQALLLFLNIAVQYIGRLNTGVAVVAMTNAATTNPDFPEYDWTEAQKSYILSSFYWGYIVTQLLGGYLCQRFGAKGTMLLGTFGSSIFSLITPFCIPWGGWQAYCIVRILQGLFQGLLFPCIYQHLAHWSPVEERTRLGSLSFTGLEFGSVLAMFSSGMIAKSSMGWPAISFLSAAIGLIWCVLWLLFGSNIAKESRFISKAELHYIETSLQHTTKSETKKIPVPWRAILTSAPFLALLIVRFATAWSHSTMQAEIPSYMNGVLEMDMKSNALFSALPYLSMWFMSYVFVLVADVLLSNKWLKLQTLRKTFSCIAAWMPAALLIAIGFLDVEQKTLAIALMTLSVSFGSACTIGNSLNTIDLSPNHAGILLSIINTTSIINFILPPLVTGAIVTDSHNRVQWQTVFIISAIILFTGNCIYLLKGTVATQPWNDENFMLHKNPETVLVTTTLESTKTIETLHK